jgi:hypothetical protein
MFPFSVHVTIPAIGEVNIAPPSNSPLPRTLAIRPVPPANLTVNLMFTKPGLAGSGAPVPSTSISNVVALSAVVNRHEPFTRIGSPGADGSEIVCSAWKEQFPRSDTCATPSTVSLKTFGLSVGVSAKTSPPCAVITPALAGAAVVANAVNANARIAVLMCLNVFITICFVRRERLAGAAILANKILRTAIPPQLPTGTWPDTNVRFSIVFIGFVFVLFLFDRFILPSVQGVFRRPITPRILKYFLRMSRHGETARKSGGGTLRQERNICSNAWTRSGEAPLERQHVEGWKEEDAAPAELGEINRDGRYNDFAPDGATDGRHSSWRQTGLRSRLLDLRFPLPAEVRRRRVFRLRRRDFLPGRRAPGLPRRAGEDHVPISTPSGHVLT